MVMSMKNKALGFIETYGYIASIEAADVSLKAANVKLIGWEKVKGGLVTIKLQGDVSAVKVAVDAGVSAASLVGTVISTTVIARPGEGLDTIVKPKDKKGKGKIKEVKSKDKEEDSFEKKSSPLEPMGVEFDEKTININDKDELEKMKVVELRRLARTLENIDMDNKDIKYGKKDELISAILSFARRGEQ